VKTEELKLVMFPYFITQINKGNMYELEKNVKRIDNVKIALTLKNKKGNVS
jgi:hypothetical protein